MRQRQLTIACFASILAFVFVPAAAGAEVGPTLPGDISTFAGTPVFGPVSATSIAASGGVAGVSLDGVSYAYLATGSVARRVDLATGVEQVVAGNGGVGIPVDGAPATETTVDAGQIAVDANGDIAILVTGNRVVFVPAVSGTYFGEAMTGGDVYMVSKLTSYQPGAIAMNSLGDIAVANYSGAVGVISIDTDVVTQVSGNGKSGNPPEGSNNNPAVAIDTAGDVAYTAGNGPEIALVPAPGGTALSKYDVADDVLVDSNDFDTGSPGEFLDDGFPAYEASTSHPSSLAFDPSGDLFIADDGNERIRFVAAQSGTHFDQTMTAGDIYSIAGEGTAGAENVPLGGTDKATEDAIAPFMLGAAPNGDLLAQNGLSMLDVSSATDQVQEIAGNETFNTSGDGAPGAAAQLGNAGWVASDQNGDVAIVDSLDSRIRFIPAISGNHYGQTMTAGDIYTIAGDGKPENLSPASSTGDKGPATTATFSTFEYASGVALDAKGDLFVADPLGNEIRFVPAQNGTYYGQSMVAGYVYEIGGSGGGISAPSDIALDSAGDVYVANAGADDVLVIAPNGLISPVAALTFTPFGIAVDHKGDLALSNPSGQQIDFIPAVEARYFGSATSLPIGVASVIAGNGTQGDSGDGGPATSAELDTPQGLAFDNAGDLVVAQYGSGSPFHDHDAVRFLPSSSGTFYGQSMAVGDIYTLAGDGTSGFSGNGGPGPAAEVALPSSVAMMPGEDVLLADSGNAFVRRIAGSVPTATTETASTANESSDTVSGSVNPQGRLIGYSFEYGTSTAYGSSTPEVTVGDNNEDHAESQTLTGLESGTTYHYRILADYDEAGATISTPGTDATFTTTGKKSEGKHEESSTEENKSSSGGESTTTGTTTTTSTTGTTASGGSSASVATSPKAVEELLHGCSSSPLVLNDVYIQGSHVFLSGSAAKSLVGKKVKILFNEAKQVATATVKANGQYTTTAPLPPARVRDNLDTRYTAEIGRQRSLHLKLVRRLLLEPPKASGATVTLTGQLTLPLTKPIAPVTVEQQLECGKTTIAKTFTPAASGRFHITLTVPANAKAAIFRMTSKVAANKHSVKHGFTTFSLPLPVAIG